MRDIDLIFKQLKEYKKISKDIELARVLGVPQNTLASWRSRGMINIEKVLLAMPEISPQWLRTGEGNMIAERPAPQTAPTPHDNITHLLTIIDRLTRVNEQQADTIARLTRAGEVAKVITPPHYIPDNE